MCVAGAAQHLAGVAQAEFVDQRVVVAAGAVGDGGGYIARVRVEDVGQLACRELGVAVQSPRENAILAKMFYVL